MPGEVVMLLFVSQTSTSCVAVVCAVVEPCVDPSLISNTNVTSPIQDISTHGDTKVSSANMGVFDSVSKSRRRAEAYTEIAPK